MPDRNLQADLDELIRLGSKYKWATGEVRTALEKAGVNLVRSDFYSESPSLADIENSFEYPEPEADPAEQAVFQDTRVFDDARLVETARALVGSAADFAAPVEGTARFHWRNSQFSSLDALAYHGLIRLRKPRRVVEIGSGFSTHVAHGALAGLDHDTQLLCIDPEPRTEIAELPGIEFRQVPIQAVDPADLIALLEPGDMLFYDGSHTLKTGSDTVYFYLKILPYLPAGVLVHAHDVNLPFPRNKRAMTEAKIYWAEQYVLMAHLYNTARYRVVFGSHYLLRFHPDLAKELIAGRYGVYGGSLWYEVL